MNKVTVSTAVFALVWTASAHAQVMEPNPTPAQQAPPQYGQPAPAPAPYGYPTQPAPPPAQYYPAAPAPAPAPAPNPRTVNSLRMSRRPATRQRPALRGRPRASTWRSAWASPEAPGRPGIATQFEIWVGCHPHSSSTTMV